MPTDEFCVIEELLGFIPPQRLDSETTSDTILSTLTKFGLDLSKMAGQAYDGYIM